MKFATDLSKGILGTADSINLWEEITAHIPDSILLKPGVKILNIACGHGTEAVILAKRMIALGISKEKVQDAIWLIDKYHVFTNHVKEKYGFTHVITCDFLAWEIDMKFDVIVGNPPYQDKDLPENNALWPRFVNKSFNELLVDKGYLAMITPSSWMNPSGENAKRKEEYNTGLIRKNILGPYNTIVVNVSAKLKEYFSVGSTFSYYVVQKTKTKNKTTVITSTDSLLIDLDDVKFLPAMLNQMSLNITNKFFSKPALGITNMKGEGFHSSHSKRVVKEKKTGFDFPLADTSAKYLNGIYLWSSIEHPYQKTKKVIVNESGYLGPMYDPGLLGTTEHAFVIPVASKKHGDILVAQLNSKIYKFVLTVCRWGSANHKYIIANLPKCEGESDSEIYKHFSLTQEEIDYIENQQK